MRTTLNIDDDLLQRATDLSGLREKTAVVHAGLEALVGRESAKRLAALGGSDKQARVATTVTKVLQNVKFGPVSQGLFEVPKEYSQIPMELPEAPPVKPTGKLPKPEP